MKIRQAKKILNMMAKGTDTRYFDSKYTFKKESRFIPRLKNLYQKATIRWNKVNMPSANVSLFRSILRTSKDISMVCSQEDVLNYMSMLKAATGVMERFSIESEVDMKIRQAKKIMKQVYKTRYWAYRQGYYCGKKDAGKLAGDHRLLKAMRLTKKWKSRKIRNEANKMLKKNPLKPRDLQRSALRLMRYGCSKA